MNLNATPDRREEEEMIAESRLDHLLDSVEAPAPTGALRRRLYGLDAGLRPMPRAGLLARLGAWLAAGQGLRPAAGMAAMACTLAIGVVIGAMLPEAPEPAPQPALATAPSPLVIASVARLPVEPDPLSVDGISLVMPQIAPTRAADTGGGEDDGVGELPLY